MRRRASVIAYMRLSVWLFAVALVACADDTCTEIGCENSTEISFPAGLVDGPYDLTITAEVGMLTARCLDASAPEADANPPELKCDRQGFTITGGDFAQMRELGVVVVDVDTQEMLVASSVDANVVDELAPNGPDCPEICYVRNGGVQGAEQPPD